MPFDASLELVGNLADRIGGLDGRLVLLAILFQVVGLAGRSVAWRNVLRASYPTHSVSLLSVGCAYLAGVAANAIAPAKAGELVKAGLVRMRLQDTTLSTIVATMAVVSLFDAGMALAALGGAVALGAVPSPPSPPFDPRLLAVAVPVVAVGTWLVRHHAVRVGTRLRSLGAHLAQGLVIMRSPARYAAQVALPLTVAWCCRLAVVYTLLHAFAVPAGIGTALVVIVVGGLSTAVPFSPGGMGAQQAMMLVALRETASTATVLSFSVGMQAGITLLNLGLGMVALMVLFRTVRPTCAVRAGRRVARTSGD